jgi:hypothetical protein
MFWLLKDLTFIHDVETSGKFAGSLILSQVLPPLLF